MRIGSLFSGAAGLDMAVQQVFDGEVVWHSEIDKAASKVLAYRFPGVPNLGDISAVDWADVPAVDVLCGGFPCQDVSAAGKRAGIKDGTRSGLWAVFADAIDALRPQWVVIENVRGLLSATAHRDVESDDATLGDGAGRPVLRAAGAVLGDLAERGYDAQWTTLAAAAVGAPHRRERVFILATTAYSERERLSGSGGASISSGTSAVGRRSSRSVGESAGFVGGSDVAVSRDGDVALLPTPGTLDSVEKRTTDAGGNLTLQGAVVGVNPVDVERHSRAGRTVSGDEPGVALLPTPTAVQGRNETSGQKPGSKHNTGTTLNDVVFKGEIRNLLPTPNAQDGNGGGRYSSDGHQSTLPGEVRLLPTPRSSDCFGAGQHGDGGMDLRTTISELAKENDAAPEGRPDQALRDMRGTTDPQTVRERQAGRPQRVLETDALLPVVREQPPCGAAEHTRLPRQEGGGSQGLRGVRDYRTPACSPQGPEPGEQRCVESCGAMCELPSEAALAGGSGLSGATHSGVSWGKYEPAIRRWERVLGRTAPNPTEPNKNGNPRLAAEFSSWLMGWPVGWVTDPAIGISRNHQLRIVGNGVCPQQATAALHYLLTVCEVAA